MKTLSLGIVIGAALGGKFKQVVGAVHKNIAQIGEAVTKTDVKLKAAKGVIHYKKTLTDLKAKQAALGGSSKRLAAGIEAVEQKYRQAKREARAYGIEIGAVIREHGQLSASLKKLQRQKAAINKRDAAGKRLGASKGRFLGLIGAGFAASRIGGQALDHDRAKIRLSTVVDKSELLRSTEFARNYAQTHLTNETEMINIQYALNSAGLSAQASRIGATVVEQVAVVTAGSAEGVGAVMGTVFNNLSGTIEGDTEAKLKRIGDVLTKTQLKFQIKDFGQLGESFKKGSEAAIKYKVGLDQTAAALGLLNTLGSDGALAGTSFNAMLRQMSTASEDLGFEIVRDEKGELDFVATVENLKEALSEVTDIDERAGLLQKSFGDEGSSIVKLIENIDQLKAGYAEIKNDSSGVVNDNYAKFLASSSGQAKMFGNNIKMIGTAFSETLFPALNMVLKPLTKMAVFVTNAVRDYPALGVVVGGIAIGIAGYATVMIGVTAVQWAYNSAVIAGTNSILKTSAAWLFSKGIMIGSVVATKSVTAATWLWNTALYANPIGLVIAGVVAFAGLAYTVYKNWEPIINWLGEKFSWIGDLWSKFTGDSKDQPSAEIKGEQDSGHQRHRGRGAGGANKVAQIATAAAVGLATNIAVASQPSEITKTTTISAPITFQTQGDPKQHALKFQQHIQALASDKHDSAELMLDEDRVWA